MADGTAAREADGTRLRVLTVCIGNMHRSPLAERLLQARFDAVAPGHVAVASAGLAAPTGAEMGEHTPEEVRRRGGDPTGFVARRLKPEHLEEADLVLAATRDIRTETISMAPRMMRRAFTIRELALLLAAGVPGTEGLDAAELVRHLASYRHLVASSPLDLEDPVGRNVDVHRRVYDEIDGCVDVIVDRLAPLVA